MSPEQLRGEELDGRSDQFSWGVVAYKVVTGACPWPATNAVALVAHILIEAPPPLDTGVPAELHSYRDILAVVKGWRRSIIQDAIREMDGTDIVLVSGVYRPLGVRVSHG